MHTEAIKLMVSSMSRKELENVAVKAIFNLRCVSSSRNSYSANTMEKIYNANILLQRDSGVEAMHRNAVDFLTTYDK